MDLTYLQQLVFPYATNANIQEQLKYSIPNYLIYSMVIRPPMNTQIDNAYIQQVIENQLELGNIGFYHTINYQIEANIQSIVIVGLQYLNLYSAELQNIIQSIIINGYYEFCLYDSIGSMFQYRMFYDPVVEAKIQQFMQSNLQSLHYSPYQPYGHRRQKRPKQTKIACTQTSQRYFEPKIVDRKDSSDTLQNDPPGVSYRRTDLNITTSSDALTCIPFEETKSEENEIVIENRMDLVQTQVKTICMDKPNSDKEVHLVINNYSAPNSPKADDLEKMVKILVEQNTMLMEKNIVLERQMRNMEEKLNQLYKDFDKETATIHDRIRCHRREWGSFKIKNKRLDF
jgi:hypothetical protein